MVFAKDVKSYDSSKVDFGSHDEFSVSVKGHLKSYDRFNLEPWSELLMKYFS